MRQLFELFNIQSHKNMEFVKKPSEPILDVKYNLKDSDNVNGESDLIVIDC